MLKSLVITSTSYLIPTHNAWKRLSDSFELKFSDYGDWSGSLLKTKPEDLLVIIFHFQDILENEESTELKVRLDLLLDLIGKRVKSSKAPTLFAFCEGAIPNSIRNAKAPGESKKFFSWFLGELHVISYDYSDFYLINLDSEFSTIGTDSVYDSRNWYFAHCRLSGLGLRKVASSLDDVLHRHFNPALKVLALDCDNTLWGGVIGEDGLEGILLGQDGLGQAFVDFQKGINKLIDEGVVVVLVSKNNENDVWEVFDKHNAMVVKRKDIVSWRINWDEKANNLRELSSELDLSLDSFVFWDDNPLEREKLKTILPMVKTVDVPVNVVDWPSYLESMIYFSKFQVTDDDKKKTLLYRSRAKFVREMNKAGDDSVTYLKSIGLTPSAYPLNSANIARAAQLCAKTNQFNLRTIRHSISDLKELQNQGKDFCFLVGLRDVYGDHGLVGLVCLKHLDDNLIFLDTFLMSCRVLGRHLEAWMLSESLRRAEFLGYQYLLGQFIPTDRNTVAKNFFDLFGFKKNTKFDIFQEGISQHEFIRSEDIYKIPTALETLPYLDIYKNE
jgi:FkbH-like protein